MLSCIKDKVWDCLNNWKTKFLSKANKEILIKAVAQAIPTYCISVFQLPVGLCKEIQGIMQFSKLNTILLALSWRQSWETNHFLFGEASWRHNRPCKGDWYGGLEMGVIYVYGGIDGYQILLPIWFNLREMCWGGKHGSWVYWPRHKTQEGQFGFWIVLWRRSQGD